MRGISPVIATVIILAVTVAVAVAVIGWITGLFGSSVGSTEQLQIMPDSYIDVGRNELRLHVVNKGSDATIYKIEVVGLGECSGIRIDNEIRDSLEAGEDAIVSCSVDGAVAGTVYTVKIYTKNGNVFTGTVQAKIGEEPGGEEIVR